MREGEAKAIKWMQKAREQRQRTMRRRVTNYDRETRHERGRERETGIQKPEAGFPRMGGCKYSSRADAILMQTQFPTFFRRKYLHSQMS